ncbi:hypothetical protein [Nocardioides marmorisolisilvae]|uniref:Big-1 domain-containing protein n=1 Tax=Nocardioides marmorisolisilvae TaxID=1542737 RepID=A0A3N0DUR5_9ACTN|nr:hypothetical protein [Nocardioides marmorisolisilvae]RNL79374.1 hypothetical protein EFL95_10320 [Nocardioides marmorisolisilvae]
MPNSFRIVRFATALSAVVALAGFTPPAQADPLNAVQTITVTKAPSPLLALFTGSATMSARVTSTQTGEPVSGVQIWFGSGGLDFANLCTGVTNAAGVVSCSTNGTYYFKQVKTTRVLAAFNAMLLRDATSLGQKKVPAL